MLTKSIFKHSNGLKTSYKHLKNDGNRGTVFYIHGYTSSKESIKANKVLKFCEKHKIDFFSFDLFGHGDSSGERNSTLVSEWVSQTDDLLKNYILKEIPNLENLHISGSSLGGYLSLLLIRDSKYLQEHLNGAFLMCPAIDFPLFKLEDLTEKEYEIYKEKGFYDLDLNRDYRRENPGLEENIMRVSKELIEDTRNLSILVGEKIDFEFDMRILWGQKDVVVPPERLNILVEKLSDRALLKTKVFWQEEGDHGLGRNEDFIKIEVIFAEAFGLI